MVDEKANPTILISVINGPEKGKCYSFDSHQSIMVGSDDACAIQLGDNSVAPFQCRIETAPPECHLINLEPTIDVFVDESVVQAAHLTNGQRIKIGRSEFVVNIVQKKLASKTEVDKPGETIQLKNIPKAEEFNLPGYEINELVGRGGMGCVFKAIQKATEREVAVKLIRPQKQVDDKATQMFIRESTLLGTLSHRRIVEFIEFGRYQDMFFLAMEYVPTISFQEELMREQWPQRIRLATGIATYVLDGLAYAHSKNIVHRDIKPKNILVYRNERKVGAKICDFGLAKNYMSAGFSGITQDQEAKGTVACMAPEQLVDCRYAQPACDVYSVACCLYYNLSGSFPHEFKKGKVDFRDLLSKDPIHLLDRVPELPSALADVVMAGLIKNPTRRLNSARKFNRALLPFTKKQP